IVVVDREHHLAVAAGEMLVEEAVEGDARLAQIHRAVVVELALDAVLDAADLVPPALDADIGGRALEVEHVVDDNGAGRAGGRRQARKTGGSNEAQRETAVQRLHHEHLLPGGLWRDGKKRSSSRHRSCHCASPTKCTLLVDATTRVSKKVLRSGNPRPL